MFGKLKSKLENWIRKSEETFKEGEKAEDDRNLDEKHERKGILSKFRRKLTEEKFEHLMSELEIILIQNNVAYSVVDSLKDSLKRKLVGKEMKGLDIKKELKIFISEILYSEDFLDRVKNGLKEKSPYVILFCGINGHGKTTTIAKIAYLLKKNGFRVCLAAADTFRAASIEQLEEHSKNLGVPLIKKDYGSDPASVGYDAINFSRKNGIDVVLIDTAGRMQNKDYLMKELDKINRVNKSDLKIFVGESITGNDVIKQVSEFDKGVGIDGIVLTKADVDEKGGAAISVSKVTGKPIFFLGTGQSYSDLKSFKKEKIIESIFGKD